MSSEENPVIEASHQTSWSFDPSLVFYSIVHVAEALVNFNSW